MQIDISSPHIPLSEFLKDHVRATLELIELHAGDRIRIINVRISDVNGPKGGQDKVCRLQARILNHPSVNTEGRHSDLYAAIRLAGRRMDRALATVFDETRNRNPKSHGEPVVITFVGLEGSPEHNKPGINELSGLFEPALLV